MSSKQLVEQLRSEAKKNPIFKNLCYLLADRKRTRGRLTIIRLMEAMKEEGFNHNRSDYENIIKFLAKLGVGDIGYSPRGKVRALNNIKIKLQSIGKVAVGPGTQLETTRGTKQKTKYESLVPIQEAVHKTEFVEKNGNSHKERQYPIFLTMMLEGKQIPISKLNKVTAEKLEEMLKDFKAGL